MLFIYFFSLMFLSVTLVEGLRCQSSYEKQLPLWAVVHAILMLG